jgi:hypothetical protein
MQVSCWVVGFEFTKNLVDADIAVSASDEVDALEALTGSQPGSFRISERKEGPKISNERWEEGLNLKLKTTDGKHEMQRFLSVADVNGLILGTRMPKTSLTKEQVESFGLALTQRTEPLLVSMFDADVDLGSVNSVQGRTNESLVGDEPPIAFIPRDEHVTD